MHSCEGQSLRMEEASPAPQDDVSAQPKNSWYHAFAFAEDVDDHATERR